MGRKTTQELEVKHSGLIEDIKALLVSTMLEAGIASATAEQCAEKGVIRMAKIFGGQQVYLPQNRVHTLMQRNKALVKDAESLSANELAAKYQISQKQVFVILRQDKARD